MMTDWGNAPSDWEHPNWEKAGRIHEWKNYVSETVRELWGSFTCEQKVALANQAEEHNGREEWE